jgi:rubredoxin-NAD+ reductase
MGSILKNALTSLGVDWHFGRIIKRIETTEQQGYRLFFSDQEFLETDLVLSAIGLRPRTELAAQAGLTVKQGIAVNRYLQSSDPHIYALGDCAEVEGLVLPYILPLMNAARALAKTLAGQQTAVEYPAMPIVVKTPICPTVISPPRMGAVGNWEFEGSGNDTKALFYSPQRELLGCVLMGKTTSERLALTKILPAFF